MTVIRKNHFLLRRLHSLTGVVPLLFFLFEHLYSNSLALQGAARYNAYVDFLHHLPYLPFIEIGLILGPLALHGLYGLVIATDAQHNVRRYGYGRNWAFLVQRLSGVLVFAFVSYHVYTLRFLDIFYGKTVNFATMVSEFSNPWIVVFYAAGVLATTYHLANGLWSFSIVWGVTVSERSQRFMVYVALAVFIALAAMGLTALSALSPIV